MDKCQKTQSKSQNQIKELNNCFMSLPADTSTAVTASHFNYGITTPSIGILKDEDKFRRFPENGHDHAPTRRYSGMVNINNFCYLQSN